MTQELSKTENQNMAFLRDATSSLEKMQAYAKLLGDSGVLPKHFYKLDQYKKPIVNPDGSMIPNIPAIILTIQHGFEVGMSVTQALQQIVPINGLASIKGDGAMALIQSSGSMASWKETVSGTIKDETYTVTITAKHKNGREKTVVFGVDDAKRLGLWVSEDMARMNDKLKHGGWWKVPARMIGYRALGFMARDLFPEVMQGMYIEEEARDIIQDADRTTQDGIVTNLLPSKGMELNKATVEAVEVMAEVIEVKSKVQPKKAPKKDTLEETPLETEPANVESKQDGPKDNGMDVFTKEELSAKSGPELKEIAKKLLGDNMESIYFTKTQKSVGNLKLLITYAQSGDHDAIEKVFGVKQDGVKENTPEAAEKQASPENDYGTTPRDFDKVLEINDELESMGMGHDEVMTFITNNYPEYETVDAFIENASSEVINQLIKSNG